ncbi:methyl-accepting chemotaxis protein [Halorubrum sp. BV1]|uniref:methyl-accepting chemotaxis protein n=1 Tax=Halorubrum sp. BV1 TaxID=1498500 RepID=UPI0009B59C62|nr:methyl-accepting chemotaxis protein [Halorubrum sp. BV1]
MQGIDDTMDRAGDAVDDTVDRAEDTARDTARDVSRGVDRTVDRAEDTVDNTVNDVTSGARNAVDEAQETARDVQRGVDRTVDQATDTADDVASNVSRSAGEVADATRDQVDHATETYGEMGRELQDGDVGAAVDTAVESTGETYDNIARAGDAAAGSTDEWVGSAEVNTEVSDDLTRGGFLSETRDSNEGLLPGEVGWVNLSEEGLRSGAEDINDYKKTFDENEPVTFMGSDAPERVLQGAAGVGVDLLNFPQHAQTLETGAEVAQNAPGEIQEHGFGEVAETATGVGTAIGGAMAREAEANPLEFASGAVFGYATGAAAGRIVGKAGRATRDRVRTAGGTKVDAEGGLAGSDVVRYTETDGAEGQQFPGARDPDTYESDPAKAVQEQADEFTPQQIEGFFDERGVTEGSVLKKALDVEPDGPGSGRSDTGFTSAPDEVDGDFAYETPGSFFGPELSPNFLRVGGGESSFSARPGLPDFGNKPTGVLARTDVENTDADTLQQFNQEMLDRSGDTTAVTKPADEVNTGEIEAVVPPGAEFSPVGSGGLTGVARRLGIGSDFYTEVGGRRVPLRPVAPKDRSPDADAPDSPNAGSPDGSGSGKPLDYYVQNPEQPVDRPLPVAGPGGGGAGGEEEQTSSPGTFDGPVDELGGFGGFYDTPPTQAGPSSPPLDEFGPTSSQPPSSPPSSQPPSSGPTSFPTFDELGPTSPPGSRPGDGPSSTPTSPPLDEFGPTSPPSSPPSSQPPSGGIPSSPPLDEFGPTSPPSSPPGSGGPSQPPSSGPPSSPPGSPPPWSPPGSPSGSSTSSPPGSPGGGGGSSGFGPSPFDPTQQQRRRDFDDERKKDEEEFAPPAYGVFDVDFQNPIASGAQVLFGGGGGFGSGFGALDESGGLQDAGGFGDELSQGGMIDETGGLASFGQPIDETGGLDEWTPF